MAATASVQDYLAGIYDLAGSGRPVIAARLAKHLAISAPAVTESVQRLTRGGYVRVGSSQEHCKFGLNLPLTETINLELRTRTEYATEHTGFRVDLSYRPTLSTSMHVALGDDMDFLSTSSIYSLFESPMDGSPGLVLYAVHIF